MANRSGDNFYNETGQSFNSNPASLKGKLQTLEVTLDYNPATNQKHFQWTQQPQEGGSDPQERKGHSLICPDYENSWCEEELIQLVSSHWRIDV